MPSACCSQQQFGPARTPVPDCLLKHPCPDRSQGPTLQGRPLMTRKPFLRMVPACCGYVRDAPASALSKCTSWPW